MIHQNFLLCKHNNPINIFVINPNILYYSWPWNTCERLICKICQQCQNRLKNHKHFLGMVLLYLNNFSDMLPIQNWLGKLAFLLLALNLKIFSKVKQSFVFALLKLILNFFSVAPTLPLISLVGPSLNTKKLFYSYLYEMNTSHIDNCKNNTKNYDIPFWFINYSVVPFDEIPQFYKDFYKFLNFTFEISSIFLLLQFLFQT